MIDKVYNPDILTCFANLSEDEVFTPPEFANKLLDELPKEIWKNKNTTRKALVFDNKAIGIDRSN